MRTVLVVFFCMALVVSSGFSFSYIAQNAYKSSWVSDREIMIQNYFTKEAYRLKEENERRSGLIIKDINAIAEGDLKTALEELENTSAKQNEEEVVSQIEKIINGEYELDDDDKSAAYDFEAVTVFDDANSEEVAYLEQQYIEEFQAEFEGTCVSDYESILSTVNAWVSVGTGSETVLSIQIEDLASEIDSLQTDIETLISRLDDLDNRIENNWKSHDYIDDLSLARSNFKGKTGNLRLNLSAISSKLDSVNTAVADALNDTSAASAGSVVNITQNIYALALGEGTSESVEDILGKVSEIATLISTDEAYSEVSTKELVELKEAVETYAACLELDDRIDDFITDCVNQSYQVYAAETGGSGEASISEAQWIEYRNNDFYEFYSCVKSLPDISSVTVSNDSADTESDGTTETYMADDVLDEASTLQRDFLGELTDFENAIIYLKYDYRMMAVFSAFIALFWDLGAFFVGCFLYYSEMFKVKKQGTSSG